ncbi:MAG: FHA domain-containing protein [Actinomycetota bacterium]
MGPRRHARDRLRRRRRAPAGAVRGRDVLRGGRGGAGAARGRPSHAHALRGGRAARTFSLSKPLVTLGRLPESDVVVADAGASRQHARIANANGEFVLTDLGSTNGTLVNDEAVHERALGDGDRITIGDTVLEFRRG